MRPARIQADLLAGKSRDIVLLDVIPLSLVSNWGGFMTPIVDQHDHSHESFGDISSTSEDNQSTVVFRVYQGVAGDRLPRSPP